MKKSLFTLAVSSMAIALLTSCGGGGPAVDSTKTQIYIYNYEGGYGRAWLDNAIARYTEVVKDRSFEEGKKGVEFHIDSNKTLRSTVASGGANITNAKYDLFFSEVIDAYAFSKQGIIKDITDVLTGENPYEPGKTIVSKIDESLAEYLNVDGKYYAIPHYFGSYGISYNGDVFEQNEAYFDANNHIIGDDGDESLGLGTGPDGVVGSDDDGLPRTYEEFYELCDYLAGCGVTPISWPSMHRSFMIPSLAYSLEADAGGYEATVINHTFDGVVDAVQFDAAGKMRFEDDGETPLTAKVTIDPTGSNLAEVWKTPSKYYTSNFMEQMIYNKTWYNETTCFGDGTTEMVQNQKYFLCSGTNGLEQYDVKNNKLNFAMCVDGAWWENESNDYGTYDKILKAKKGDEYYSRKNRKVYWMPLPKPTEDLVGQQTVYRDTLKADMFVKSTVSDSVLPAIKDFLYFINTDAEMVEFTKTTSTTRNMKYSMPESALNEMSAYGRSYVNQILGTSKTQPAKLVTPLSQSPLFQTIDDSMCQENTSFFSTQYAPEAGKAVYYGNHLTAFKEFLDKNYTSAFTGKTYFEGIYKTKVL